MLALIISILGMIIGLAVLVTVIILPHELGHFLMAKKMGVKVEVFSIGFGRKLWSRKKGETEYIVCAIPIGGYIKMAGEEPGEARTGAEWEFYSKPVGKRFNIIASGAIVNYILGALLFCAVFMTSPVASPRIGEIIEGYPAQEIGLRENDIITKVDGWEIRRWMDILRVLAISNDNVNVEVERDGQILEFEVYKKIKEVTGPDGKAVEMKVIGIAPVEEALKYSFFGSMPMAVHETLFLTKFTYVVFGKLITGGLSIELVGGPIMIISATGQAARAGIIPLLKLCAFISVSIAMINLLPLPPLDGGHILFLLIEKLKKRPIDIKVQEAVQKVGWILLITLMLVVSWNDILRFFK